MIGLQRDLRQTLEMISLNCSKNARKRFGLESSDSGETPEWHEEWRLDILEPSLCGQGAIFTNNSTLFSFLVPSGECDSFERVYRYFLIRLQFTLVDAKSSLTVNTGAPRIVSKISRSVIGSVNDMKFALELGEEEEPAAHRRDPESSINRTPYKAIGYEYPIECFYRRARETITQPPGGDVSQ